MVAALLCASLVSLPDFDAAWAYASARGSTATVVMDRTGQIDVRGTFNTPVSIASGTKSFSGVAAALLARDGLIRLDDRVSTAITEWQGVPGKQDITYRQLLSLSSGLSSSGSGESQTCPSEATLIATNLVTQPGTDFAYGPRAFNVFSLAAERRLGGQKIHAYLQQRLFQPLGMTVTWMNFNAEGRTQMGGGAILSAADWAKFGMYVLQGGVTSRGRTLDASVVSTMPKAQGPGTHYGLSWWLSPTPSTQTGGGPSSSFRGFLHAAGFGGQTLIVLPDLGLVLVRVGRPSGSGGSFSQAAWLEAMLGRS